MFNDIELLGEGVEIGTFKGEFAEKILSTWNGRRLHCVDNWTEWKHDPKLYRVAPTQSEQDKFYAETVIRLAKFGERSNIIREPSLVAVNRFADSSLDFVYVDASHEYQDVLNDMNAWCPKVKAGGILCGDDFTSAYPGVILAVKDFARLKGVDFVAWSASESPRPQWFIYK